MTEKPFFWEMNPDVLISSFLRSSGFGITRPPLSLIVISHSLTSQNPGPIFESGKDAGGHRRHTALTAGSVVANYHININTGFLDSH